jgi:hypothetical protein
MLIKDNHIFFHIDFGHLWNNGPFLDAPRIAIPDPIKTISLTKEEWGSLKSIFMDGFSVLYKNVDIIVNIATSLFKGIEDSERIRQFITGENSLMVKTKLHIARHKLGKIFRQSYDSITKSLKNFAHRLQVSGNSSSPIKIKRSLPPFINEINEADEMTKSDSFDIQREDVTKSENRNESRPHSQRESYLSKSDYQKREKDESKSSEDQPPLLSIPDQELLKSRKSPIIQENDLKKEDNHNLSKQEEESTYQAQLSLSIINPSINERVLVGTKTTTLTTTKNFCRKDTREEGKSHLPLNISLGLEQTREDFIYKFAILSNT